MNNESEEEYFTPTGEVSYATAGVDIEAGEKAVELFGKHVKRTMRPEVIGGIGGFAGLFKLNTDYKNPVLVSATDGVGTKLAVAHSLGIHNTVGIDLVAMVVDDIVVSGAEPLFLLDYIAIGKVIPEIVAHIVEGIADGCAQAGCSLLGGETAEHPGLIQIGEYDIAATGVGVVEQDKILDPHNVRPGDVVIGMASSGLHSNGYSLARKILLEWGHLDLHGHVEEFGKTLGEELLIPTKIYAQDCLALARDTQVRTFAHVTGGGLANNLARVIPPGLRAYIDRGTWVPQPVFELIGHRGRVDRLEMEKAFNMGVGMVAIVAPEDVDRALAILMARHTPSWVMGEIRPDDIGNSLGVTVLGEHPKF